MDASTFDYVKERVKILTETGASKQETKDAASAWLAAVEADSSEAAVDKATEDLLEYLEGRPHSIDDAIAFGKSEMAVQMFGEEGAKMRIEKDEARKAAGEKYCGCDACQAACQILLACACAHGVTFLGVTP